MVTERVTEPLLAVSDDSVFLPGLPLGSPTFPPRSWWTIFNRLFRRFSAVGGEMQANSGGYSGSRA